MNQTRVIAFHMGKECTLVTYIYLLLISLSLSRCKCLISLGIHLIPIYLLAVTGVLLHHPDFRYVVTIPPIVLSLKVPSALRALHPYIGCRYTRYTRACTPASPRAPSPTHAPALTRPRSPPRSHYYDAARRAAGHGCWWPEKYRRKKAALRRLGVG